MEIEYSLTEADITALVECRLKSSQRIRKRFKRARYSLFTGFLLMAIGSISLQMGLVLPIVFVVFAIGFFAFYPTFQLWQARRAVSRTYHDEKNRRTLDSRTLRISEEGLEEESFMGKILVKWFLIEQIFTTADRTILFIQDDPSLVIPKVNISVGNYDEFVEAIQTYRAKTYDQPN